MPADFIPFPDIPLLLKLPGEKPLLNISLSLLFAFILAGIHLLAYRFKFLQAIPRSKLLSFGSGAAVAYIFLHLMPELEEWQKKFWDVAGQETKLHEHALYLIALAGLCLFYGLERHIKLAKVKLTAEEAEDLSSIFWLHIGAFALYNIIIGYLLVRREQNSVYGLFVFFLAMGFHFLVNDYGLQQGNKVLYKKSGRWVVSLAVLIGWLTGLLVEVNKAAIAAAFAFVAGAAILNIMKEELPEERKSNYIAFFAGSVFYVIILML